MKCDVNTLLPVFCIRPSVEGWPWLFLFLLLLPLAGASAAALSLAPRFMGTARSALNLALKSGSREGARLWNPADVAALCRPLESRLTRWCGRWQGTVACWANVGGTAGGPLSVGWWPSGRLTSVSLASIFFVVRKELGEHTAVTLALMCRQAELVLMPASHEQACAINLDSWRPRWRWFATFSPRENTKVAGKKMLVVIF